MWISKYFTYFILFSFLGWIYETTYCTTKNGKWDNRGFLYGPICPIYGVGGVLITIVTDLFSYYHPETSYTWWQVFLVAFFGSIVLEYVTSWLLEKLFHAYWWDYSNLPFNINGRVCLPCSLGFGAAGLLVVYTIAPATKDLTAWISPLGYEFLALVLMSLISADTTLTVSALTHFENIIVNAEKALNDHMDEVVDTIEERKDERRQQRPERLLRHSFASMGSAHQAALRRVEGFRQPRRAQQPHMEFGLRLLRNLQQERKEQRRHR
jgi:uncharacterized membrane protein